MTDSEGTPYRPHLETEVQFLKGVGSRYLPQFHKLGIHTVGDLLRHFPRRYEDRRSLPPMSGLREGIFATVRGEITRVQSRPTRGGKVILNATLEDRTGQVNLMWFNQPWMARQLEKYGGELIAYGMVRESRMGWEIANPEIETIEDDEDVADFARIVPVYPLTEGLPQRTIRRAVRNALTQVVDQVEDPLPRDFRKANDLDPLVTSLREIHLPTDDLARDRARRRLVFDEFFYLQVGLQLRRRAAQRELGIAFPISQLSGAPMEPTSVFEGTSALAEGGTLWDEVHAMLPFELTGAQRRVIHEIWRDMERPAPMNRLVQGDVGSGKTAVAACALLAAVRCGWQGAMMAPTEILAEQHYINLHRLFDPLGIPVVLLVGKLTASQRRSARQRTASGEARIAVGTHALVQEGVEFAKLGLAVVDEQHRFGVLQRAALRMKGTMADVLVMTATPIPRTLAMTQYGDLDLSVIDELPPGRKPIKTHWKRADDRDSVYAGVRKLIDEGRQAYFVCPMISDSERLQTQAAQDLHYRLSQQEFEGRRVGLLHGQMKPAEKETVMNQFRAHELDILVSTVVIEVGVDVPNASVMVIEDAHRFGLAQLHQLRGRVGRGAHQSFCVLIGEATSEDTRQRLQIMTETNDGFRIAEADFRLRGPGELAGTRQSGMADLLIADLTSDGRILEEAREAAIQLLDGDPDLSRPEHAPLLRRVQAVRADFAMATIS